MSYYYNSAALASQYPMKEGFVMTGATVEDIVGEKQLADAVQTALNLAKEKHTAALKSADEKQDSTSELGLGPRKNNGHYPINIKRPCGSGREWKGEQMRYRDVKDSGSWCALIVIIYL